MFAIATLAEDTLIQRRYRMFFPPPSKGEQYLTVSTRIMDISVQDLQAVAQLTAKLTTAN